MQTQLAVSRGWVRAKAGEIGRRAQSLAISTAEIGKTLKSCLKDIHGKYQMGGGCLLDPIYEAQNEGQSRPA